MTFPCFYFSTTSYIKFIKQGEKKTLFPHGHSLNIQMERWKICSIVKPLLQAVCCNESKQRVFSEHTTNEIFKVWEPHLPNSFLSMEPCNFLVIIVFKGWHTEIDGPAEYKLSFFFFFLRLRLSEIPWISAAMSAKGERGKKRLTW